jgi:transcriptional regulator GlxA family with amidase domain
MCLGHRACGVALPKSDARTISASARTRPDRTAGADVRPDARWVDDGEILTAGGVTSGIDLALHLLERLQGTEAAEAAEHLLEHRRLDTAQVRQAQPR